MIAVVGVGETPPRIGDERSEIDRAVEAIHLAADDAGLDVVDIDGFATEAYSTTRHIPVDQVAHRLRIRDRKFSAQMSLAGAGVVATPLLARMAIESGQAEIVVCYYGINLTAEAGKAYSFHEGDPAKAAFEMPFGFYGQPVYFAPIARRYMHEFGLKEEHLGAVAVSTRAHAARTPGSLRVDPISLDGFLAKPMIADPLRALDCCLVNDGASAFIMTSLERARDLRQSPAVVAGVGWASKPVTQAQYFSQSPDLLCTAGTVSGPRAFAEARIDPGDVDIAEIYDCFTIAVLMQFEDIGLAPRGGGGELALAGAFGPDGSLPVNTHGGLLSHSYTVGAGHVVEAVRQLRGTRGDGQVPGAEVAVVTGLGAMDHATLVLTTDR